MLFFSEVMGHRVLTSSGDPIGKVADLLFLGSGQPLLTKLVVQTKHGPVFVPTASVRSLTSSSVMLKPQYKTGEWLETELSLRRNLLDQQIIDIKGNKVVRVNDVAIQERPYLIIAGVDVGVLGIARWFKLERLFTRGFSEFGRNVSSNFLAWEQIQPVELSRGKVVLKKEETKLTRLRPEDLADHLERLSVKNLTKILDLLPNEYAADVVQNLNVSHQRGLFHTVKPSHAAKILALVEPDEAVDILLSLSANRRGAILRELPEEAKEPIEHLLSLSKTDIGGLATTDFFTAKPEETAERVRRRMKRETELSLPLTYVYVVNKKGELVGVCNLHELIMQDNDTPVYKFMIPNVVAVSLKTPTDTAIRRMTKYKIYALPIINEKRRMLGIVTIDDLVESLQEKLA
jgi:CBS domain-containing protein/sporulation protein YlmC with PRC-barrel domain